MTPCRYHPEGYPIAGCETCLSALIAERDVALETLRRAVGQRLERLEIAVADLKA